jgi:release factor glutamine methyltransferase
MTPVEGAKPVTVLEVIQRSTGFLQQKGVESPRLQVELILALVLGVPRLKLYLNFERILTESELGLVREMVKRRGTREPLQHILGSVSFCGLEMRSSRVALIPRPETELLAERAWQFLASLHPVESTALDLGTGTGCIAIAVAVQAANAVIHAVDLSAEALALARENAEANKVAERIRFHHGDGFNALPPETRLDLIISNPPYIASDEIGALPVEVRDFDPRLALDGGSDGLDFHRRIASEGRTFLKPAGRLMLEFGDGQAEALRKLLCDEKWIVDEIIADYSARPRILIARPGN